ncbi:MAG: hypothetical protein IJE16_00915 [Ruminococcus sp.]|nr:hypothetical protein [Ruminococcus sp.]
MKIVFFVILSFLAIVGISHIIFELYYRLTKFNDDDAVVLLFPKDDKSVDLEFSVRSIVAKAQKLGAFKSIVLISDNLSDYSKKELSLLQKDYSYLSVLSKEAFKEKAGL